MTQTLMAHGKIGAEALAISLNTVFDPIIQTIHEQGGFVTGFAGDALMVVFPHHDGITAITACQTADAIATSMMCLGWREGLRLANQEGWCVLLVVAAGDDMEVKLSESFQQDFPDFETIPSDAEAVGGRIDESE